MKKLKIITTTVLFLFFAHNVCKGMLQDSIHALKIGEKVPNIELSPVLNYKEQKLKISDFHGKLLILDFWSVHCTPCIAAFPKLKDLQDEFGEQVMILPVSFNNPEGEIVDFINKRRGGKYELKLPTVVQDSRNESILRKLFPFNGMPHLIWIDGDGILRAITDHYYLNKENINIILTGKSVDWPVKHYDASYIPGETLFQEDQERTPSYFHKSMISGNQNGKIPGVTLVRDSLKTRITIVNYPIPEIIKISLGGQLYKTGDSTYVLNGIFDADVYYKRLKLQVKDKNRFVRWADGENDTLFVKWAIENTYCYELTLPSEYTFEDAFRFMKLDLSKYFKIEAEIQSHPVPYLALVRIPNNNNFITKGGEKKYEATDDKLSFKIRNMSIDLLVGGILIDLNSPIVLNETGYTGMIDIDFKRKSHFNLSQVNNELNRYGLDLVKKSKKMDVLVIEDK